MHREAHFTILGYLRPSLFSIQTPSASSMDVQGCIITRLSIVSEADPPKCEAGQIDSILHRYHTYARWGGESCSNTPAFRNKKSSEHFHCLGHDADEKRNLQDSWLCNGYERLCDVCGAVTQSPMIHPPPKQASAVCHLGHSVPQLAITRWLEQALWQWWGRSTGLRILASSVRPRKGTKEDNGGLASTRLQYAIRLRHGLSVLIDSSSSACLVVQTATERQENNICGDMLRWNRRSVVGCNTRV